MTPQPSAGDKELRAKLDIILKSHACTQVYFDEDAMNDYPVMLDKIIDVVVASNQQLLRELLQDEFFASCGGCSCDCQKLIHDKLKGYGER